MVVLPSDAVGDTLDMSKVGTIVGNAGAVGVGATTVPVVLAANLEGEQFDGSAANTASKTDADGILRFGELDYGTYWVVELDTPVDYQKPYPMKIVVDEGGVKYFARSGGAPEGTYKASSLARTTVPAPLRRLTPWCSKTHPKNSNFPTPATSATTPICWVV